MKKNIANSVISLFIPNYFNDEEWFPIVPIAIGIGMKRP